MKTIKNVTYNTSDELEICHINVTLFILNDEEDNKYKGLMLQSDSNYKLYDSYSKDELTKFQNILLMAYVFLNDQLDDAIKNSESKKLLDEIKSKVIITRKHLRFITNHIDSYENILKDYKDI